MNQMTAQRQAGWKTQALVTEPESKSWNADKREFQLEEMQGSKTRKRAKQLTDGWNAGEKEKRQDRKCKGRHDRRGEDLQNKIGNNWT